MTAISIRWLVIVDVYEGRLVFMWRIKTQERICGDEIITRSYEGVRPIVDLMKGAGARENYMNKLNQR